MHAGKQLIIRMTMDENIFVCVWSWSVPSTTAKTGDRPEDKLKPIMTKLKQTKEKTIW